MPKLWSQTIEEHRRSVGDAILDTTWELVAQRGPLSVTMSEIAERAGIGRATLYKYFPDVEAILVACHQRHVSGHLRQLEDLRSRPGPPSRRLEAVLGAYALIAHHRRRHGTPEIAALVHRGEHVAPAERELLDLLSDLLAEAREAGEARDDVAPGELAAYCLHALAAAGSLPSEAAVRRLVEVTLAGVRPPT